MPPPDYAIARKLVPPGGIAQAPMTPEEQAYLEQMKAQAEPWSNYLGRVASNAGDTFMAFLPTALGGRGDVGVSDIVVGAAQGAGQTAGGVKRMMTGEMPLFDPVTGRPNPEAVGTSFDAIGYLTGASAAAPSPKNALRAGAKGVRTASEPYDQILVVHGGSNFDEIDKAKFGSGEPGGIRPLGDGLYGFHVPMDNPEAAKRAIEGAQKYARKYGRGEKAVQVFSVPKSVLLGSNGPLPLEGFPERELGKPGQRPTPQEVAEFKAATQLNSERLPSGDVELSILDPSIATRVGKFKVTTPADEVFKTLVEGGPADTTTLNTGLGGFLQRGMQMLRSPEGKGGGGVPAAHPSNPAGSKRAAEVRNGFFLKSEELMWKNPQKSGTAEQFLGYLKKAGVKDREIEALGLDKLTGPTTKEDFIDHIRRKDPAIMEMKSDAFSSHTVPYENTDEYMMSNYVALNMPGTLFTHAGHGLPDNTLFHNRYTIRQDGNRRVLNVEESQSDWAQTHRGRFRGTKASPDRIETLQITPNDVYEAVNNSPTARPELLELGRDALSQLKKATESMDDYSTVLTVAAVRDVHKPKWFVAGKGEVTPEKIFEESAKRMAPDIAQNGAAAKYRTHVDRMFVDEKFGNVGAPYVTSGSAGIVPLALKQALLKGVQVNADEITITPGAIHAERWGGTDKRKSKGLTDYYDKVFAKEAKSALKEIGKDAGMDLQFKVEQKPWMVSEYFRSQNPRVYGNPQRNFGDWKYNTPSIERARFYGFDPDNPDQLAKAYYIDRVLTEVQDELVMDGNFAFPEQPHFESYEQTLRDEIRSYKQMAETMQKSLEGALIRFEKAKERGAPEDEIDNAYQVYNRLNNELADQQNMISIAFDRLALIPEAKRVVEKWKTEIMGSEPPPKLNEGVPALTLELTPELKDYIQKNGLPKFAKGGIVDLAMLGARA